MRFEFSIAVRYLRAKRRQTFLSVVSFISVLGFTLGVMALIIALALMTGFQEDIQSKILGASAHVMVYSATSRGLPNVNSTMELVLHNPSIVSVSPVVYGKVMIYSPGGTDGIVLKGIDPEREAKVTGLAASVERQILKELENPSGDRDGIILGSDLAASLRVQSGDLVTVVSPENLLSPLGLMPKFKKLQVLGEFHSGLYEYDQNWALISIQAAQRLFSLGDTVNLIEARVNRIYDAREISAALQLELGNHFLTDNWIDQNQSLFSAMKLEKLMLFITIGLIVIVASFNVISTLVMMVLDKNKDIAILMAMGCTSSQIMRIFLMQGMLLGIAGTIVGAALGVIISHIMDSYQLIRLPLDVYFIPYLPFHVRIPDFLLIVGSAVLISFLSTLYPALRASKIEPAEALRYE